MNTDTHRIVLILGNGFDLDLGLKTSFKDFWKSNYCPKDYPAPLIWYMNGCPKNSIEKFRWYDLENELYNYYQQRQDGAIERDIITSAEQQFLIHFDPNITARGHYPKYANEIASLIEKGLVLVDTGFKAYMDIPYLQDLRKDASSRDKEALIRINNGLRNYLKGLDYSQTIQAAVTDESRPPMSVAVLQLVIEAAKRGCIPDIFIFNYTNLLSYFPDHQIMGGWLHHIHGNCDGENIIIGTRDDVNIGKDYDFLYKSFAPGFKSHAIVSALRDAKEIIIYGHSLGENDQQYFKDFFAQQTSYGDTVSKNITIFTKDNQSVLEIKRALQKMTNNRLSSLYALNNLRIIKTTWNLSEEESVELESFFDGFKTEYLHKRYSFDII